MSQMDVECWKEKRDMEPFTEDSSPAASTGSRRQPCGSVGRSEGSCVTILGTTPDADRAEPAILVSHPAVPNSGPCHRADGLPDRFLGVSRFISRPIIAVRLAAIALIVPAPFTAKLDPDAHTSPPSPAWARMAAGWMSRAFSRRVRITSTSIRSLPWRSMALQ